MVFVHKVKEGLIVSSTSSLFPRNLKLWLHLPAWESRKEMNCSSVSHGKEHKRGWLEAELWSPNQQCCKGSHDRGQTLYSSLCWFDVIEESHQLGGWVCHHYWRWKCQIPTFAGSLADKSSWESLRERGKDKLSLNPAALEASLTPTTHQTAQLCGSVYIGHPLFSLRQFVFNFLTLKTKNILVDICVQYNISVTK